MGKSDQAISISPLPKRKPLRPATAVRPPSLRPALVSCAPWADWPRFSSCNAALAARSRRELAALTGMFLIGQIAAAVIAPRTSWEPAPRLAAKPQEEPEHPDAQQQPAETCTGLKTGSQPAHLWKKGIQNKAISSTSATPAPAST